MIKRRKQKYRINQSVKNSGKFASVKNKEIGGKIDRLIKTLLISI